MIKADKVISGIINWEKLMNENINNSIIKDCGFNVKGKGFVFNLDKYSCHERLTGKCFVNDSDYHGLDNDKMGSGDSRFDYCPLIAKSIIDRGFNDSIYSIRITKYACGHYGIEDGQHRICISHKLNIPITVYLESDDKNDCYVCEMCKSHLGFRIRSLLGKGRYHIVNFR